MKIVEEYWTMGAYDAVVIMEAPDDETMNAFILKVGSLGNLKGQTLRAFRRNEMEKILAKLNSASQSPNFAISADDKVRWLELHVI